MQINLSIFTLFTLLIVALAADTENWTVLNNAAQKKGVTMTAGTRYMFFELWAPKGDETDCISGYAHVRLIVGTPSDTGNGMDFHADAFDLKVKSLPPEGKQTISNREIWRANYYQKPDNTWRRVSTDNDYEYQGITTSGADVIESLGLQYQRDHPIYHVGGRRATNCRTYVDWLRDRIEQAGSKRSLNWAMHRRFISSQRMVEVTA